MEDNIKSNEKKSKWSPLTIALFTVLALYVLIMLVMLWWVFITASKAYINDYKSLKDGVASNIIGLPKQFMLFSNIAEVANGFAKFTLIEMALNTVLYSLVIKYSLSLSVDFGEVLGSYTFTYDDAATAGRIRSIVEIILLAGTALGCGRLGFQILGIDISAGKGGD